MIDDDGGGEHDGDENGDSDDEGESGGRSVMTEWRKCKKKEAKVKK